MSELSESNGDRRSSADPTTHKLKRIVEARQKLRARFLKAMASSPSVSDQTPLGHGPSNRHGMPQIPPGQHIVEKWPVLDLGITPTLLKESWSLEIDGLVAQPLKLSWEALLELEQVDHVNGADQLGGHQGGDLSLGGFDGWHGCAVRAGGPRRETNGLGSDHGGDRKTTTWKPRTGALQAQAAPKQFFLEFLVFRNRLVGSLLS